jgi:hypothetical protein
MAQVVVCAPTTECREWIGECLGCYNVGIEKMKVASYLGIKTSRAKLKSFGWAQDIDSFVKRVKR